ncbi:hypothetical protein L596_019691 [Steinernema carpocapsae]|uniref:Uncharacterized protein n=1 Tax=Steinernema carpocapsae TaxID=34508 RepID=A0A4U5MRS7_STECR|nr:hypothetical protein L596_019691 [Steinernema carpocapsae]
MDPRPSSSDILSSFMSLTDSLPDLNITERFERPPYDPLMGEFARENAFRNFYCITFSISPLRTITFTINYGLMSARVFPDVPVSDLLRHDQVTLAEVRINDMGILPQALNQHDMHILTDLFRNNVEPVHSLLALVDFSEDEIIQVLLQQVASFKKITMIVPKNWHVVFTKQIEEQVFNLTLNFEQVEEARKLQESLKRFILGSRFENLAMNFEPGLEREKMEFLKEILDTWKNDEFPKLFTRSKKVELLYERGEGRFIEAELGVNMPQEGEESVEVEHSSDKDLKMVIREVRKGFGSFIFRIVYPEGVKYVQ